MSENEETEVAKSIFLVTEAVYLRLKFLSIMLLPAISTLYFTLGSIWNFNNVEQVVGTIAAINTFLGVVLGLSTKAYNASDSKYDGVIAIGINESGDKLYSLELNGDPNEIDGKDSVMFKVGTKN